MPKICRQASCKLTQDSPTKEHTATRRVISSIGRTTTRRSIGASIEPRSNDYVSQSSLYWMDQRLLSRKFPSCSGVNHKGTRSSCERNSANYRLRDVAARGGKFYFSRKSACGMPHNTFACHLTSSGAIRPAAYFGGSARLTQAEIQS